MTLGQLVVRYALFAGIATAVNLGVQRLVLWFGTGTLPFIGALLAGTMAGLVAKYVLDKKWIFYQPSRDVAEDGRRFTLYTAMGLITTAIFWSAETGAWLIWHDPTMREVGAVLGLTVGYVTKYHLDRRFVFTDRALAAQPGTAEAA